jgi:hypothetical protein
LLGFRKNPMSPAAIREREAQEKHMDAFKRALNFQPPAAASPALDQVFAAPGRESGWNSSSAGSSVPNQRNPYDSTAGTYLPAPSAAPMAPVSPVAPFAPAQANPYTAPAAAAATQSRIASPRPDFSVPQRPF